jgi:hypothetical protein
MTWNHFPGDPVKKMTAFYARIYMELSLPNLPAFIKAAKAFPALTTEFNRL